MALQSIGTAQPGRPSGVREWVVCVMNEATRAVLGRNMKVMREAKGWSQRELARVSGIAQPDISDIERADPRINPTLDKLEALAKALGTTPGHLLSVS